MSIETRANSQAAPHAPFPFASRDASRAVYALELDPSDLSRPRSGPGSSPAPRTRLAFVGRHTLDTAAFLPDLAASRRASMHTARTILRGHSSNADAANDPVLDLALNRMIDAACRDAPNTGWVSLQ